MEAFAKITENIGIVDELSLLSNSLDYDLSDFTDLPNPLKVKSLSLTSSSFKLTELKEVIEFMIIPT